MKRVLIIVQNLPVPFDRRVWQEAVTLRRNGYQVSIICPKGKGCEAAYEVIDDVAVHRHPMPLEAKGAIGYLLEYSLSLFWEFILAWKIFLTSGFDILHACNPPDMIFLIGGFFRYLFGKKFVFDHHDINPELYEAKFGRRGFFYRLLLLAERLTFATADIVISTNQSYRRIALERGKVAADKVFVVRSGPDLQRMRIVPPAPLLKRGKRYLIGYLGVIGKQEGIGNLLEAAHILVREYGLNDIHFTIIGDGPALKEMRGQSNAMGLGDYVNFTGRIGDKEMLGILNTADICVNPDTVNEMNDKSTMNKIMEYMALAKPIVQFETVEGRFSAQNASLYAKANDARDFAAKILDLLNDPDLRERMGTAGLARVRNELAWDYEAPKLLAAYNALSAPRRELQTV